MVPAEVGRAGKEQWAEHNSEGLLPIVIAAAIWGQAWGGKTVRAQRDNMAVNWDILARFLIDPTLCNSLIPNWTSSAFGAIQPNMYHAYKKYSQKDFSNGKTHVMDHAEVGGTWDPPPNSSFLPYQNLEPP